MITETNYSEKNSFFCIFLPLEMALINHIVLLTFTLKGAFY